MRTRFYVIYLGILFTLLYFLQYPKPLFSGKPPKVKARELKLAFSFPRENEKVLLAYPTAMDVDEEAAIFHH